MMKNYKFGQRLPLLAVVVSLCLALVIMSIPAFADNTIDLEHSCSMTVRVARPDEGEKSAWDELSKTVVTAQLYKVADLNADGSVVPTADYQLDSIDMSLFPSGGDEGIELLTEQLIAYLGNQFTLPQHQTLEITDGVLVLEEMEPALYLLVPEQVALGDHGYQFSPSLFSLPTTIDNGGLHVLTYDPVIYLKSEPVNLFGSLLIEKILLTYHTQLGNPNFIFEVKAVKNSETVYNNVVTIAFDAPGVKQVLLDNIPVGAQVTVNEISDSPGYQLISKIPFTPLEVLASDDPEGPAKVTFINDYEHTTDTGGAAVNHFESNLDPEHTAWHWSRTVGY